MRFDVGRSGTKEFTLVKAIGHQATEFCKKSPRIDRGQTVVRCQRDYLGTMNVQKAVWHHDHVGIGALRLSSEDTSKIGPALDRRDDRLNIEGNSRGLERIEIVVGKRRRSRIEQKSGSLCLRRARQSHVPAGPTWAQIQTHASRQIAT